MQFATIVKDGKNPGSIIIILDNKEARTLYAAFEEYCSKNKGKVIAKKMFKQMETDLECF